MTAHRKNESFPTPSILKAFVGAGYINSDSSDEEENPVLRDNLSCPTSPCTPSFSKPCVEKVTVLYSSSGARYELGRVLKKAIHGLVLHSTLLAPVTTSSSPSNQNQHKAFTRTKVSFAIKIYSKQVMASHEGRSKENPLTEISAMQFLGDHYSNIMGQVECCADDLYVYSIMRFCPGGELFDHILQHGKLSEGEARRIFRQLIAGLQVLEERGVGHLDISLENILYNVADRQIMIIDFGMCTKLTQINTPNPSSTQNRYEPIHNNHCGKKNYMAPEIIAQNDFINAVQCDVWSAGVCLLYILLGFPPIEIASLSDMRYRYLVHGKLKELLEHWGISLSEEVIDLLQSILQDRPDHRLSIQQILAHRWMQQTEDLPAQVTSEMDVICMTMEDTDGNPFEESKGRVRGDSATNNSLSINKHLDALFVRT